MIHLKLAFLSCLVLTVGFGCGKPSLSDPAARLRPVIEQLMSPELEERTAAVDFLREMAESGLTKGESIALLEFAAREFPPLESDWRESCSELIRAAATVPDKAQVETIEKNYSSYTRLGKEGALRILASLPGREAVTAYAKHVVASSEELENLPTGTLAEEPRFCEILLPPLLPLLQNEHLQWGISELSLACLQEKLPPSILGKAEKAFSDLARHYRVLLAPKQQEQGLAWIWQEDYQENRNSVALVLDVLGRLKGPAVNEEISAFLSFKDPRLRMFAVFAALRNGIPVNDNAINSIAASAEVRNWFYRGLDEIGRTDVYPKEYFSFEAFAEGDMVNWLIFPTELAQTPDEIELMKTVSVEFADGVADYFLFRFKTHPPHWAAEDGWMAGVSGPFLRSKGPSPDSYGDTFSTFDSWDSMSPEEHVQKITDLLNEKYSEMKSNRSNQ